MKNFLSRVKGIFFTINKPVVQTGPDSYMLTRSNRARAFTNTLKMKANVIRDANAFAASKGQTAEGISATEVRPIIGTRPSFQYRFKLVDIVIAEPV